MQFSSNEKRREPRELSLFFTNQHFHFQVLISRTQDHELATCDEVKGTTNVSQVLSQASSQGAHPQAACDKRSESGRQLVGCDL